MTWVPQFSIPPKFIDEDTSEYVHKMMKEFDECTPEDKDKFAEAVISASLETTKGSGVKLHGRHGAWEMTVHRKSTFPSSMLMPYPCNNPGMLYAEVKVAGLIFEEKFSFHDFIGWYDLKHRIIDEEFYRNVMKYRMKAI